MSAKVPSRFGAATLLAALAGGCVQVADVEEREDQTDAARVSVMQVKTALLDAEDVWSASVRVIHEEDAVTLRGFVASERERSLAIAAAREATPLRVIDELQVWEASDR